jgi:phi13 family phage major tail protein
MTSQIEKITYGLKNVCYAEVTEGIDGTPVFGALMPWAGVTEMSLPPVGEPKVIYADDIKYMKVPINQGYEGNLSVYQIPEDFRLNHLGEYKDENGAFIEKANVMPKDFALVGQFTTANDEMIDPKVFAFYKCSASRPDVASTTKEESFTESTFSIPITVDPTIKDEIVKSTLKKSSNEGVFESWFDSVYYNPAGLPLFKALIKVVDSGTPVAGAVVLAGQKVGVTDSQGIARFSLGNGTHDILVSGTGGTGIDSVMIDGQPAEITIIDLGV